MAFNNLKKALIQDLRETCIEYVNKFFDNIENDSKLSNSLIKKFNKIVEIINEDESDDKKDDSTFSFLEELLNKVKNKN